MLLKKVILSSDEKKLALFKHFIRRLLTQLETESHDLPMTTGGHRNQSKRCVFTLFEAEAGCERRQTSKINTTMQ